MKEYCIESNEFISSTSLTATTDTETFNLNKGAHDLTFCIKGDAYITVLFEAESIDGDYYAIRCNKVGSDTIATSTDYAASAEVWQNYDSLVGFKGFRTRISAVSTSGETDITGWVFG